MYISFKIYNFHTQINYKTYDYETILVNWLQLKILIKMEIIMINILMLNQIQMIKFYGI